VVDALPWLILGHPDLDWNGLIQQVRLKSLQNRLGYVIHLARKVAESNPAFANVAAALAPQQRLVEQCRLQNEDTLCEDSMTAAERNWLRRFRPPEAAHWNLLTGLTPEHLRYAA